MKFRVEQDFIKQGNAVVAVLDDSDRIMWSWHIWVTDYKLGDDLKTIEKSSRSYKMLPVNLGWCDGESLSSYEGRSVKVRFTQEETNKTEIITITQTPYSVSTAGNAPYYQWGRKDPMLPCPVGYKIPVNYVFQILTEAEVVRCVPSKNKSYGPIPLLIKARQYSLPGFLVYCKSERTEPVFP